MFFLEGHRRELRIRADGADGDELGHAGLPRLVEQMRAHHQVVVEELARPLAIGADPADDRGEMNDERRLRVAIDAHHLRLVAQIVFAVRRREDCRALFVAEFADDVAAQDASEPKAAPAAEDRAAPEAAGRQAAQQDAADDEAARNAADRKAAQEAAARQQVIDRGG